mgnify:CR=1 FL=1
MNTKQFAYSYLLAFMFLPESLPRRIVLVLLHHLFDAELVGADPAD